MVEIHLHGTNKINTIDYITIQSTGNAIDFGDLFNKDESGWMLIHQLVDSFLWRMILPSSPKVNVIDYVTTSTLGNAADFGDLTYSCQDSTAGGMCIKCN